MNLSELLESKFRGDIRFRGQAYLKAERVTITRVTSESVSAVVRDGGEFATQLRRDGKQLQMFCTCAETAGKHETACKHLWATILAVDEARLLTGGVKPGYIPPFVVEPEKFLWQDNWDEADDEGDVFYPPHRAVQAIRVPLAVQPRLKPWEARLQELRERAAAEIPAGGRARREREILYLVDVAESRSVGQLVLETSQRQRRSNGQWGKLKPLKLRPGQLESIAHGEDRRILSYLGGGVPERSNWYAQQAELQGSVYRYRVPFELCELLLPLMCRTGRVRLHCGEQLSETPLEWDPGPPWELVLRMQFDADAEVWRLEGLLQRPDETMPLDRAALLLPGGLIVTERRLARLQDFGAFEWIPLLTSGGGITAAEGEQAALVDALLDMPVLPRLELPPQLRLEEVRAAPRPILVIRAPRGVRWQRDRLQGEIKFDYLGVFVEASSSRWAIVQRELGRCILRDREGEERAWGQVVQAGFRRLHESFADRGPHPDVEIPVGALGRGVRALIEQGWQVCAEGKDVRQPGEMHFSVRSGIDWFELHGAVDFGGQRVPFPELLSALARGETTIRLDDGSLGIVPEEWLQKYGLLAGLGTAEDDHLRFSRHQAALLDALLATLESVDYDRKFLDLREQFRTFGGVEGAVEPEGFRGVLRGYQKEGLGWLIFLREFGFGGCLADDMGLGKTIQLLAALQQRRAEAGERRPSLIVVPKSLIFNWKEEAGRFTPQLSVLEYAGLERAPLREQFCRYDIVLTTYGTLRRDIMFLKDHRFDYVVLDEAQTIKNAGSQIAKASRLLQGEHRVALSGTPIENHLGDLWSIFEFLNPGMLGRSSVFKLYAADSGDEDSRRLLAQALRPFILRRTKRQVAAELPEKIEQTIHCRMGKEQRRLYEEMRDHFRSSLLGLVRTQGLARSKMHVLEALLRLRQAACHPGLLHQDAQEHSSAKLDVLCPHLEELLDEGHKALVFSQFTSMLSIVRQHLDKRNIVYEYLDGQTRHRRERVHRFQNDPACGVFLISLKAGGLGLNLTAADYVFLLDPWWNPAVEMQAIDRAHRVGQTRKVCAYRLICSDTVEEKIAELQSKKRDLAEAILEADAGRLLRDLSIEDLELLLS